MSREYEAAEAFNAASVDAGLEVSPNVVTSTHRALADQHYGFIMEDNLRAATELINSGADQLPIDELPLAMHTLATLLGASGEDYRDCSVTPSSSIWETHINNVREGRIQLLPFSFWMSALSGRRQAQRADEALDTASTGVEHLLAALNYQIYFKPQTMAGAARTLSRSPEIVATSEELEAMPHLSVTNWTIGQTAQHVYEQLARQPHGSLRIIDMCSGTGATLAAITNRLAIAQNGGTTLDGSRIGIVGFEATPAFYEQLGADYLASADGQLKALGINTSNMVSGDRFSNHANTGEITVVEGDVVKEIEKLDFSDMTQQDVVLGTVNYGFHRLSTGRKLAIMRSLAKAPNSIICIGDLRQNGSAVNRGYFNLANNGPLNAGNINLEDILKANGYHTYTIGVDGFEPSFVDEALRTRLASELTNDGFVTIAVRGEKAHNLVFATT